MPDAQEHLGKAARNEAFLAALTHLPVRYPEWEITAMFYAALHYGDAFLATLGEHPTNHHRRIARLDAETVAGPALARLFDASMSARYHIPPAPLDYADGLRSNEFRQVKAEMLQRLPP